MADMIKFFKGAVASLPTTGVNGAIYITTDEGGIYLGTGTGMKRLGDFIQVDAVANLPTNGANTSALYYCVAENVLAKWNGSEWTQINKQRTKEETIALLGLGTMAYKSEVAEGDLSEALKEKVNAAAEGNHSHSNKGVLDGITADKVTAWDAAEGNAKGYADGLNTAMNTRVEALEAIDHEHANKALLDTYTQTEANLADAVAKKHSHTFVESELNKIAAGDVAKWNGVVADHLVAADKTELVDSIGDVNTALETYKTSNNEALAGVKATADAAATKEYTDAELAKKVAKTDYEADKATFATKTDIAKLAGVSEGANKVEASTNNGSIKIDGVETVVYTHPDKHAIGDVTGLQDALDAKVAQTAYDADKATFATKTELGNVDAKFANYVTSASYATDKSATETALADRYTKEEADGKFALIADAYDDTELAGRVTTAEDKIADLETESAKHATKDELAGVDAKFADYTKTADLPTDLGDFTNNAGYAKTADVNTELDKKADKTQVATDIANAIAPLATTEALNGVDAKFANYTNTTDMNAKFELKADKTALEATDKTLADVKATVDNFFAEDAAVNDTIDTLKEIAAYIATDKEGAADITARVGALEGKVDVEKVSTAIADAVKGETDRATEAEGVLSGRIDTLEAIDHDAYKAADTALHTVISKEIDDDVKAAIDTEVLRADGAYDTKGDAAKAQAAAEATAAGALATARTEITAEIDADVKALADGQVKTNTEAIATKANSADVYAKTETFTKDEVNAAIAAAVEAAHTWGSF